MTRLLGLVSAWDVALLRLVNGGGSPGLDPWMKAVSDWKGVFWPAVVLLALLFLASRLRARVFIAFGAVVILAGDFGICQQIKVLVDRPRPCIALSGVRVPMADGRVVTSPLPWVHSASMPSNHAFNIATLALLFSVFYGGRAHLGWLFAALVAFSRVYLGAHYPTDVVVGLALGLAWGLAAIGLGRTLWSALGPRLCPSWHERHPALLPPPR